MNVCLLGEKGDQHDEGMKNTSMRLDRHLRDHVDRVSLLDLRRINTASFWRELRSLDPDVFHLIPGPTPQGLTLLDMLSRWKNAQTVATATQPRHTEALFRLGGLLAPDRLFVQSTGLQNGFESAGFKTEFLPSGVDLEQFEPISAEEKRALRLQLDLPPDERLFLHVGHFKQGRNVLDLLSLQEFGTVVVIGSPSTGPEAEIVERLRDEGCVVRTEYIEQIEQYYQCCDAYAFPTQQSSHSIQVPLSVFEAMACGLPVVATRFGGLTDCFDEGGGLRFVESITNVTAEDVTFDDVTTRQKVSVYSWDSIAERVAEVYVEL